MKRKNGSKILLILALVLVAALALAACDKSEENKTISGVTFEDVTVDYDGNAHEITVSGVIPEGVSVEYHSNKATAVGEYSATAILTGNGYKTLILDAKLTIRPLQISGVSFENATVSYDGNEHELKVTGNLPDGVMVTYKNNVGVDVGEYNASATLSGEGFSTVTLTATLSIVKADITGVTFDDKTVDYDGETHSITVTGDLPNGVSVKYQNNSASSAGVHHVTAILSGNGYNTLTLTAKLTIKPLEIVGVTFNDITVAYDGNEHEITVSGNIPSGVSVTYGGNKGTEAGEYTATAVLSGEGFQTLTLTAKLTVVLMDADTNGVTFGDVSVDFDGNEHSITITGTLPQGVSVSYKGNTATQAGEYNATATFTQENRKDVTLTAKLTIRPVAHVVVNNSDELLAAAQNGGLILLGSDITLDNGDFVSISKNTRLNGMGHTLSAVNYADNYRVINVSGAECKEVLISNLNVAADKWVQYLRGINLYQTENLTLNVNNVNVSLCDYYAMNLNNSNVNLTVNLNGCNFSAWAAVLNHASGVEFNAVNSVFRGKNTHTGPSNGFSTLVVSNYVLYNNGDTFELQYLSANNTFTLTDCEIIAEIALDADGNKLQTTQKIVDMRSPYNTRLTLNNCSLTTANEGDKPFYSAYDSAYIPDENRDDPNFVVNTNEITLNGTDVTENEDYVEKYFDE